MLLPICYIRLHGFYCESRREQRRDKIFHMENAHGSKEKPIVKIVQKRLSTAFLFDACTHQLLHGSQYNLLSVFFKFFIFCCQLQSVGKKIKSSFKQTALVHLLQDTIQTLKNISIRPFQSTFDLKIKEIKQLLSTLNKQLYHTYNLDIEN